MRLAQRLSQSHGGRLRHIQRPPSNRHDQPGVGPVMNVVGNTGAFAPKKQGVAWLEGEIDVGLGPARCEKDQSTLLARRMGKKGGPGVMAA